MEIADSKPTKSTTTTSATTTAIRQSVNAERQSVKDLYIKKYQLEALENERFAELPYYTFARSFAVKYAEYLGIKNIDIAKKFDAVYPDELKVARDPIYDSLGNETTNFDLEDEKSFRFNPILFLAFVAVLALAVFLSKQVSTAEEEHKKSLPIDEGISKVEQRQGAMLDGYK